MAVLLALAQVVQNLVHVAQLDHHRVGNDEGAADVFHLLQVLDGVVLKIDLGRHLEPLHIDPPLGDTLFVDQVDGGHVLADRVLAVAAAAQGQGRGVGVVDVADSALRRGAVHDDTAYLHAHAVLVGNLHIAGVDNRGVAQAAQLQHGVGELEALFLILADEVGQHGAELLLAQRMIVAG